MTPEQLIRQYYDYFNARRFEDASRMLAPDAHLETQALGWRQDGSAGYVTFTRRWLSAFPDGRVTVERIDQVGDSWYEVSLIGEGTHEGDFDMGALGTFRPTHRHLRVRFRHIVELRDSRIASSALSFDTQDLVRQFSG